MVISDILLLKKIGGNLIMANKKFDIDKYSKAKILSPKKYRVWYKQIQENGKNEQEMQQLTDRLRTDIEGSKATRKKLFSKWWLKELISAAAIVGLAFLINFFTPFSPFTFFLLGVAMLAAVNIVTFGVIPGIRFLNNKYKGLVAFRDELNNQEQLNNVEVKAMGKSLSKEQIKEQTKNFVDQNVLTEEKEFTPDKSASNQDKKTRRVVDDLNESIKREASAPVYHMQPVAQARINGDEENAVETTIVESKKEENTEAKADQSTIQNVEIIEPTIVENSTPLAVKELHFESAPKPKYVFRVKTRTMTADGNCPNEDVFVNISTTNLDKFIESLSKKNFGEKGMRASRSQKAKKANAVVLTVENARELIDTKLQNGELTQKQAEKLKKQITEVVLVLEITNMNRPEKGTVESKEYTIEQKEDFFKTVDRVKNKVLEQAQTLKAKMEEDNEMTY